MIDAEFFHGINTNYSRPKITKPADSLNLYDERTDISNISGPESDYDQGGSQASGSVASCSVKPDVDVD